MISCPNKTLPEWKSLVKLVGETNAYSLWALYEDTVPENLLENIETVEETNVEQVNESIPIKKLQEILIDEINGREGYPDNMISA